MSRKTIAIITGIVMSGAIVFSSLTAHANSPPNPGDSVYVSTANGVQVSYFPTLRLSGDTGDPMLVITATDEMALAPYIASVGQSCNSCHSQDKSNLHLTVLKSYGDNGIQNATATALKKLKPDKPQFVPTSSA